MRLWRSVLIATLASLLLASSLYAQTPAPWQSPSAASAWDRLPMKFFFQSCVKKRKILKRKSEAQIERQAVSLVAGKRSQRAWFCSIGGGMD